MNWPAFTELTFLAVLASERPSEFRHDPERIATIAIAAERVQSDQIATWHRHPRLFGATLAAVMLGESGLREDVHSGTTISRTGDICLMQISPVNTFWKSRAPFREALVGVEPEPTAWCIGTGAEALIVWDRYCSKHRPRRNWLEAMLSGYAGDRCHPSKGSRSRTREVNRLAWTRWEPTEAHRQAISWVIYSEGISRARKARELAGRL